MILVGINRNTTSCLKYMQSSLSKMLVTSKFDINAWCLFCIVFKMYRYHCRIYHTVILDDPFDDPAGLADLIPDRSPEPTKEQLQVTRGYFICT